MSKQLRIDSFRAKLLRIPGLVVMAILFAFTTMFFVLGDAHPGIIIIWVIVVTFSLALYSYSFISLLPAAVQKPRPFLAYIWRVILTLIFTELPVLIISFIISGDDETMFAISIINSLAQLTITTPLSWFVYKKYNQGKLEVQLLKKELGQSTASIDLIRSQINPHFLFNALNTLYGTALQEKAERTSEGIQKLGDMMRFMLQENTLDEITLEQEIEYLNNYIALQRLRTDTSSDIQIEVDLPQQIPIATIPPMLLIPLVENAFKHGISLLAPSYIKIVLGIRNETLYFDVTNSMHGKQSHDPEKYKGGIGLNSVKQRLDLFYPGKHELIVKESAKDFFAHLTLQLNKRNR